LRIALERNIKQGRGERRVCAVRGMMGSYTFNMVTKRFLFVKVTFIDMDEKRM
jgi:hypothetical protein